MAQRKGDELYFDTTIFNLALFYLKRKIKKQIEVADLFETCELILQKVDLINRHGKKIRFEDGKFIVQKNLFLKKVGGE